MQDDALKAPPVSPDWDKITLSTAFEMSEGNLQEGLATYPQVSAVLEELHRILLRVTSCVQHDGRESRIVPRMLMTRVHSTIVAASRLAWGGHVYEVYPLLRVAIEQAWYALHMASDPKGTVRARTWLCRNDNAEAMKQCKLEFKVGSVRGTHEALDEPSASEMQRLYEWMIDFGAHPNQMGMLSILERSADSDNHVYGMPVLTASPLPRLLALRMTANVGVGVLHVFRLIYPERWRIAGLDVDTDRFAEQIERVFRPFANEFREETPKASPLA